jgi:NTP pyrophosphatase (non-canonical NTP hydrolase)
MRGWRPTRSARCHASSHARRRTRRQRCGAIGAAPLRRALGRTVAVVTLDELAVRLREFAAARAWEQFHTPKNLAMALAGEVGELLAELQWLTPEETAQVMADPEAAARMRSELADVTIYLVRLADVLGLDLIEAARAKLAESESRYDVDNFRGSARKAPPLP